MIEQIKSRIKIEDLVQRFGLRNNQSKYVYSIYKPEKTPSMRIYERTNSYYCFSSGVGGDVIKFYQDYYKIETKQAIKELADLCGLSNQHFEYTPRIRKNSQYLRTIEPENFSMTIAEKEFFEERVSIMENEGKLTKHDAELNTKEAIKENRIVIRQNIYESLYRFCISKGFSKKATEYLTGSERNLKSETIARFKIFEIHSLNDTMKFLRKKFTYNELELSGLFSSKEFFVFTFHRIIIPYIEHNKINYLRGRYWIEGKTKPENHFGKYIGLVNTFGGLTSKRLFNIDLIKHLEPNSDLYISEGEFDSMILNQFDYKSIGIPGVTNFTENHIALLKNFNINLCFDNDSAGEKAVKEIAKLFNRPIKQIKLKHHKDFTELANETN